MVIGTDTSVPNGAPAKWSRSYFYDDPVYDHWRRTFRGFHAAFGGCDNCLLLFRSRHCLASLAFRNCTSLCQARIRVPIEKSALVVENGRIAAVGRQGDVKPPAGARRIDLGGKTIMPTMNEMVND